MDKFRNKNGELTRYSLACGYIFRIEREEKALQLWQEHSAFHVRMYDRKNHERVFWKVFDNDQLTLAKKLYYQTAKEFFKLSKTQAIKEGCFTH
jgi:hypothetical protein